MTAPNDTDKKSKSRQFHPDLHIDIKDVDDEHISLVLKGVISHHTTPGLLKELLGIWEENGGGNLTLQINEVKMLDSDGIGALCGLHEKLAKSGHGLCLLQPSENIRYILKTMMLDRMMEIK